MNSWPRSSRGFRDTSIDMDDVGEITAALGAARPGAGAGQRAVLEQLMPLVYRELKRLAHTHRYRWSGEPSPGTTSLVHEAYLRLAGQAGSGFVNRRQFYALASRAMRSILIDNARWQGRLKRGGGAVPAGDVSQLASAERSEELLALDEALGRLEESDRGWRASSSAVLRRPHRGRDRRSAGDLAGDGQARLEPGPHLALPRAAGRAGLNGESAS